MASLASAIAVTSSLTQPVRLDLRRDGVTLAVESFGDPAAPAVLFTHGFGQTRHAWTRSAQRLAEAGWRALLLDARGHGESGWNAVDQPYAMAQFVDDLEAVAAQCAAPPVLVGASMGGLIGMFSAARASQRYDRLILVDITPRWDAGGVARILDFMGAHPDGFVDFDQAANAIARYLPHRTERKTPEQLRSLLVPRADGRLRWHWDPRLLHEIARGGERFQDELLSAAAAIRLPTLLISGGRSDLILASHIDEFLQRVPGAQHVQIADATHMVAGDRNDQFTDTILDFLAASPATFIIRNAASTGATP